MRLLCGGRAGPLNAFHLPLEDHMHHLNAAQNDACTTKIPETPASVGFGV